MKSYNILVSIPVSLMLLSSCDLKEHPTSFPTPETFYENETQCRASLNGCYQPAAAIFTADFMLVTEACTDLWYSYSSTKDAVLEVTPAKPQFGATLWRQGYLGVMRCNEAVDCITKASFESKKKMPLQAEARVLRAFYYYLLTNMFDGVPFYMERVATDDDLLRIRNLGRTPANEIRRILYDDLNTNALPYFTDENGLKKRPCEVKGNTAGYAMALMLMAKFAMWYEDWEAALDPLKKLEALYGELSEANYPLEQIQWRYKNVPEGIFEIQHDWSLTGLRYNGNVSSLMTPTATPDSSGVLKFDGIYMPELSQEMTTWSSLIGNNHLGMFRPEKGTEKKETADSEQSILAPLPLTYSDEWYEVEGRWYTRIDTAALKTGEIRGRKIDRRTVYTLGLGNLNNGDTFNYARNYGVGWAGPKFWCPGQVLSYDANNYRVFRYADAILMMAECYCKSSNSSECMKYLNKTRHRAGIDPIDNDLGDEAFMLAIRDERARELAGEFTRKFDLVRWGVWYDLTMMHNTRLRNVAAVKPCHQYYPIPETQCSLSNGHLTNDAYYNSGL